MKVSSAQQILPGILPSLVDRIQHSIALLQIHQPKEQPYYGCFSGGKDSVVIKTLAEMAGVNISWHYNQTTIDPPELVWFIRQVHPDVLWTKPRYGNFFHRMEKKGFPTRLARWCCAEYKETAPPKGSQLVMGVRAAESPRRAKAWKEVTLHTRTNAYALAPILSWSDNEVWQFIRGHGIPYCSLYDEGFKRLGCIGCPMAGIKGRQQHFQRWPRFEFLWRRAFERVWERRTGSLQRGGRPWFGNVFFHNASEMFEWWMREGPPGKRLDGTPTDDEMDEEEDSCQIALDMLSS